MLENDFQHDNNHLYKKLGGAWGGTLVRSFWALPGCIFKHIQGVFIKLQHGFFENLLQKHLLEPVQITYRILQVWNGPKISFMK